MAMFLQETYRGMNSIVQRLNNPNLVATERARTEAELRAVVTGVRQVVSRILQFDMKMMHEAHLGLMKCNSAFPEAAVNSAQRAWLVGPKIALSFSALMQPSYMLLVYWCSVSGEHSLSTRRAYKALEPFLRLAP